MSRIFATCCLLVLFFIVNQSLAEEDRCCFRYGYGSRMVPCCLKIIPCEEYDNLFEGYEDKEQMVGGRIGEHHVCPNDAEEAERLAAGASVGASSGASRLCPFWY